MTADQAVLFRQTHLTVSVWWVIVVQLVLGGAAVLVARWWFDGLVALSVMMGVAAVLLPSVVFARGVTGRFARSGVAGATTSFFLWELVKLVMTVALLWLAHRTVQGLSWPALLVGLVLALKAYWIVLAFQRPRCDPLVVNTPNV